MVLLMASATYCVSATAEEASSIEKRASPPISESLWEQLPAHPRLFANDARISSLKVQSDKVSKDLLGLLKNAAEIHLTADKIVYPTGRTFKFDAVRNAQGRILTLALSYRIFGDDRYLNRAKAELLQLAESPDWCPSHFIDVGEASFAAGEGLDWLYNFLTVEERSVIAQGIIKNALEPSLSFKENEVGELTGNFNHNPVNNGGLIAGALAVAEREPQLARKVVERAIKFLPIAVEPTRPMVRIPKDPPIGRMAPRFMYLPWKHSGRFSTLLVDSKNSPACWSQSTLSPKCGGLLGMITISVMRHPPPRLKSLTA